jgi:predicted ATP-grasp superfamily ATP-dependent carboligase
MESVTRVDPGVRTRVLVLDGNENQAVAAVRSLARAGHDVRVGAATAWSKAGWSKFCGGTFVYPAPQDDARAFVDRIVQELDGRPRTLVLPMTERTTLPLSSRRSEIVAAGGLLVLPEHQTVLKAFDKAYSTRLARLLGVAVPRTTAVKDYAGARDVALSSEYPVVLKPRMSEELGATGPRPTGPPLYASSPHDFMVAYRRLARRCGEVLVQEFVPGTGVGYFALMRHGELLAEFAHRRLRDVRPTGSGSSLRESAAPHPVARVSSLQILEALGWHGPAMVEYRLRPDGTPVFLEINGRFWNSLALAVHAGVDFPRLLAQLALTGDAPRLSPYRLGVRCRWLLGDVRHLFEVLRGAPAGYPGRFPGRLKTLLDFLRPVSGTHHDNFRWDDPLPELGDWLDFLRRLKKPRTVRQSGGKELHVARRYSHP